MIKVLLKHVIYEIAINKLFNNLESNFSKVSSDTMIGAEYQTIRLRVGNISRYYSDCVIIDKNQDLITFDFSEDVLEISDAGSRRYSPMFNTASAHVNDLEFL